MRHRKPGGVRTRESLMKVRAASPGHQAIIGVGNGRRVGWSATCAVIGALLVSACGGGSADDADPGDASGAASAAGNPSAVEQPSGSSSGLETQPPYTGYPDSIAVIAHSAATGEGTAPPTGTDPKANSWATGTNPEVNSIYQRILAENPDIEGNTVNLAVGGATMADMNGQAQALSTVEPRPELVLIQTIDNDIACPATEQDYESFGADLSRVLDTLEETAPNARVFLVTQFGSPETYAAAMSPDQRVRNGQLMGAPAPCAFLDADGNIVPEELRQLEGIITSYEAELGRVCKQHELCTWDHNAMSQAVEEPQDINDKDLAHFSIPGHAHVAALAWAALKEQGLIPAS